MINFRIEQVHTFEVRRDTNRVQTPIRVTINNQHEFAMNKQQAALFLAELMRVTQAGNGAQSDPV